MFKLKKSFQISCSHILYETGFSIEKNKEIYGKCSNQPSHGHNYTIILFLKSDKLNNGMIINFNIIKDIFKKEIEDIYDHQFLNNCPGFEYNVPTVENMSKLFYVNLKRKIEELYAVEIFETNSASAIYDEEVI